nr:MAG: hypothetical protein [Guiyang Paspalum paspaloides tombus-like virus 1]
MIPLWCIVLAIWAIRETQAYWRPLLEGSKKRLRRWVSDHPTAVTVFFSLLAIYYVGPLPVVGWFAHKYWWPLWQWATCSYGLYYKTLVARAEFLRRGIEDWANETGAVDGDKPEPYVGVMYFGSLPSDFLGGKPLLKEGDGEDSFTDDELVQQASAAARVKYGYFNDTPINAKIVDRYIREYLVERKVPRSTILKCAPVACRLYFTDTATDEACSSGVEDF